MLKSDNPTFLKMFGSWKKL